MQNKELKDISWNVTEEEYRKDPALSYSTLAKYERTGFNGLNTLFDKVESPSLTFGSAVDAIITGGMEEFNSRFEVASFPKIDDSVVNVVKEIFNEFGEIYNSLDDIDSSSIITITERVSYRANWRPETRVKVIKEQGSKYYELLGISKDKILISSDTYNDVMNAVDALKNSDTTSYYFAPDNPFDDIKRYYQLKFKAKIQGVNYRCMFDLLIVDYKNKTIQPVDLKTSHKKEWDFYKSFVEWNYQIQNRLYAKILQENIEKDDFFEDFKILDYKDIVICKDSLTPLVWDCPFTKEVGTLLFGIYNQIVMRDPIAIGDELNWYLTNKPKTPININIGKDKGNNLSEWLNTL